MLHVYENKSPTHIYTNICLSYTAYIFPCSSCLHKTPIVLLTCITIHIIMVEGQLKYRAMYGVHTWVFLVHVEYISIKVMIA